MGHSQQKGLDYNETFAPVIKQQSLRLLLATAVQENLKVYHLDISTAFLYGKIEKDLFIEIPEGLTNENEDKKVLKFNKSLYWLKQAPWSWNTKFVKTSQEIGLKQLQTDNFLFVNNNLMVAVYVDDMIVFGQSINHIIESSQLSFILGIRVEYKRDGSIILNQKQYIEKFIKKFDLEKK